jgi:hypothetical protein
LLAAGHLRVIVIADAVSFAVAAALIAALPASIATRGRQAPSPADHGPRPRSFLATLRSRRIRGGLTVTFVDQIAQGIFVVLFILFVARELHGGSSEIGLLRGVQAIGAIGAGLALSFTRTPRVPGRLAAIGSLVFGILDLTIWNAPALTTGVGVYVALFVIAGAPGVVLETGLISHLQLAAGERELGRVFGAFTLVSNAGQGVGMLAAGLLTAPLGLMALLNAQGCLYLLGGVLAALTLARGPGRRAPSALRATPGHDRARHKGARSRRAWAAKS